MVAQTHIKTSGLLTFKVNEVSVLHNWQWQNKPVLSESDKFCDWELSVSSSYVGL
jgi:hypothetical protein